MVLPSGSVVNSLVGSQTPDGIWYPGRGSSQGSHYQPRQKAVKIDNLTGSITEGKWADLLIVDPTYHVEAVYRDGVKQKI